MKVDKLRFVRHGKPMYTLLSIETSSHLCSVALYHKGALQAHTHHEISFRKNAAAMLAPQVKDLLFKADLSPEKLTHVAVNRGPGSFTGLRIGLAFAQGLCFPKKLTLLTATSFEVISSMHPQICDEGLILLDTKCKSFYSAWYPGGEEVPQCAILQGKDLENRAKKARHIVTDTPEERPLMSDFLPHTSAPVTQIEPLTAKMLGDYLLSLPSFPDNSPKELFYLKEPNIG